MISCFVFRSDAEKSIVAFTVFVRERHLRQIADHFVSIVDARLRFRRARLRTAPQPINFGVHAIFERLLPVALRVQILLFLLQKRAVVARHAQRPIFVRGIQLHDFVRNILEKIAVVAHHHAGKSAILQHAFEPLNSREIEMVRRLVQQQNVGRLHEFFYNREPLTPPSGHARRIRIQIGESRATKDFGRARGAIAFRYTRAFERPRHNRANRGAFGELRNL